VNIEPAFVGADVGDVAYDISDTLDTNEIVGSEVDFYAHVFLRNGTKLGYWKRVAHCPKIGTTDLVFRDSWDYGNPEVRNSHNWHVWKINSPFIEVGRLEGENRKAEIGVVVTPSDIVDRMRSGRYNLVYPEY
jgi:hypothetical protein